jgi:hypothetical protein
MRDSERVGERRMGMTTPIVVGFDVEPDGLDIPRRERARWRGFERAYELTGALRGRLETALGAPVSFSWYLRMDPQIADVYGTPLWVAETYSRELDALRAAGDELALHPHALRWDDSRDGWLTDSGNAAWVEECVRVSFDTFRMKGLILAGGTATRLDPLTRDQQAPAAGLRPADDLLPARDPARDGHPRGDGHRWAGAAWATSSSCSPTAGEFGLDLSYRYQRGALGIAHAIGLARDFVGDDSVLRRPGRQHPARARLRDVAAEFEAGPGAGHAALPRARPGALRRRRVRREGRSSASRRSPQQPKSDLIPIGVYFLRPTRST